MRMQVCMKHPRKYQALCQWPFPLQTTRDHDMAPSAAQGMRQHEQGGMLPLMQILRMTSSIR